MKVVKYERDTSGEKILRLVLKDVGLNGVTLCAVDDSGVQEPAGNILTITHAGLVSIHGGVNPDLGLKLDSERHVEVEMF